MKTSIPNAGAIRLGRQGENLATRVVIPLELVKQGNGSAVLIHQRSKDTMPYPVSIEVDCESVVWSVTSADTAYPGNGQAELRWVGTNGEVIKSKIFRTQVERSMGDEGEAPAPYESWVNDIAQTAKSAEDSANRAQSLYEQVQEDLQEGKLKGEKGEKGDQGLPGEVSAAQLAALVSRLKSGSAKDAELHLGFYLDVNGDLCQKED